MEAIQILLMLAETHSFDSTINYCYVSSATVFNSEMSSTNSVIVSNKLIYDPCAYLCYYLNPNP